MTFFGYAMNYFVTVYLAGINLLGLLEMGLDKKKARRHVWRVPEKTFFLICVLGGSLGTWAGMYLFRHKTRHRSFVLGVPAIFFLQVFLVGIWLYNTL